MNSIQLLYKMDTLFMNSKNSKTADFRRLLFYLTDQIDL